MKIIVAIFCFGLLLSAAVGSLRSLAPQDPPKEIFWEKFKNAVIKKDKAAVAALSEYPVGMPYGYRSIRNKAQLIQRYREVFNHEGDQVECFKTARPESEAAKPNAFIVACPNIGGDLVVIYSFGLTRNGWRFNGLDNINE